ncbi:hypothetical protein MUG10_00800 [Xanthomonas prunicola]|uniref:hypothetical protein n=1 Tax=Xanthomonas prunicola TaxID=2053930 RepID=UPI002078ADA0|nr:hypothetical protein [Xanthomonas prunicola]USJ00836.1 hypothetical protein MUG10_00800 [Xanthomonas prunicola]
MTKLWEDTVVTALRDIQWMHALGKNLPSVTPPGFVKLDGNAESALGDVLYSANDKYFVIEVKSSVDDICTEWGGDSAKSKPKLVYQSLAERWHNLQDAVDLVEASTDPVGDGSYEKMMASVPFFQRSAACHMLCYWDKWKINGKEYGDVVVTPYLSGCLRVIDPKKHRGREYIDRHFDSDFLIGREVGGELSVAEVASLNVLFESGARAYCVNSNGGENVSWHKPLGLGIKAFQQYVDELVDQAGVDVPEMHGIVMNRSGTVFKLFSSLSELKHALVPGSGINSLKSSAQKVRSFSRGAPVLLGSKRPKP